MKGKNRCKILKDIRRRIAEENGIEYVTSECKYKGDCLGTCPKCESEVAYLERELERRRSLGYKVTVAGIAAGITLSSVGCTPETTKNGKSETLMGDYPAESSVFSQESSTVESGSEYVTDGEIEMPLMGIPTESQSSADSSSEEIGVELIGEVAADWSEYETFSDGNS